MIQADRINERFGNHQWLQTDCIFKNGRSLLSLAEFVQAVNKLNLPVVFDTQHYLEWKLGIFRDLSKLPTDQKKLLLFTSGKRRIEQEGVYLESAQVPDFPQDFIDYYTKELTNAGFKQTLNSSEPIGTTITFAKDDLFLTFGVKNVFQGTGENKKISGYKAFIEHN